MILAADVLEHVRKPEGLLRDMRARLTDHGTVITSVPNFGHWYPRARVVTGRFGYDRRGILDEGHVRFFTRHSFETMVTRAGYAPRRKVSVGLPLEAARRGGATATAQPTSEGEGLLSRTQQIGVDLWPTLFGFQFLYELEPLPSDLTP